jgi:homoserine kinase type II
MGAVQWRPFLDNELPRAPLAAAAHPFVSRLRDALRTLGPLAESAAWPRRILHGDVFLENVMCEGERVVAIVDWEECCAGPPLLDVAMTLVGCCYSERNVLEWPLAEAFLRAYHASLPLSAQARDALPDFLRYALFSIAFWRFRQFRVRRPDAAREDAFAQMTARIDSLDEPRLRSLCAQLA